MVMFIVHGVINGEPVIVIFVTIDLVKKYINDRCLLFITCLTGLLKNC